MSRGEGLEVEARMRRHDGAYHWFLYQLYPLRDKSDRIIRWCGARIDIDAQKQSENRAQRENLALREEIDKVSMFEEIVGTSPAFQAVLARVTHRSGARQNLGPRFGTFWSGYQAWHARVYLGFQDQIAEDRYASFHV
jgi:hypothetical protein